MEEGVAPTDSRHRPDQRLMEQARWDEANSVKVVAVAVIVAAVAVVVVVSFVVAVVVVVLLLLLV